LCIGNSFKGFYRERGLLSALSAGANNCRHQSLASHTIGIYYYTDMMTITFPDRETEKRALAFLLGRFSGRVLRSGEHIVPEAALEALADQNIPFSVIGRTTYEQQMAAIRGPAPTSVQ
jgi:hypothetical protein